MKFSTKSRYGLRVMLELSLEYNQNLIQIKDLSARQQIPEKYLEQIILALRAANLVKSVRGARGGYFLARNPSEITVREVIEKMEGSLYPVDCAENASLCKKAHRCATIDIWKKIGEAIYTALDGITLESLMESYRQKNTDAMFYI